MKALENSEINPSQDDNLWQNEVIRMKQEIKQLQENKRQLTGEDLSALSPKDLQHLEKLLEMSLQRVRDKKDEILIEEVEELHRKERCLSEENTKLRKMISMMESSSIAGTVHDFCLESMNDSEVQAESSEAAISVPDISLQLNLSTDSSRSYHVISKSRPVPLLW